jgi:hypothetical protein
MIRINLLHKTPAQVVESASKNTSHLFILFFTVGIILLLGIFGAMLFSYKGIDTWANIQQQDPPNNLSQTIPYVEEEVIHSLRLENRQNYKALSLDERVNYQHHSTYFLLNLAQTSTLPNILWKKLDIATPGEVYVSGFAPNRKEYHKLLARVEGLSKYEELAISRGVYQETKQGTIFFSLRGILVWNAQTSRGSRVLSHKKSDSYLQEFVEFVNSQGLQVKTFQKKKSRSLGAMTQATYQLVLDSRDIKQIQTLLKAMYTSKSYIGISKISIQEKTSLDLVLYTNSHFSVQSKHK